MKKFLSLLGIAALLFTACENNTNVADPTDDIQIKLTSKAEMNVSNGNAMALITYEILQLVDGATIDVVADVNWISDFNTKSQGRITFNIANNPTDEVRVGKITVTYDKSSFEVTVNQALSEAPTNKEVVMPKLQGKYYGIQQGLYNYYLAFSDLGLDDANMYSVPNAHYYFVDLYLDVAPADMNNIVVPNGEYEFDATNSGFANTFTKSFSWYQVNDGNGLDTCQSTYETGKLIVEDGKVTLDITLQIDGVQETHKVVYEGEYSLLDCTNEVY